MMDILKKEQPIAYQILENEFSDRKIPHAFLIVGKNNEDLVTFLAQSILCEQDVACGKCNVCSRVERNIYPDIIRLSGKETSIKKKDIEDIQIRMTKSSIEGRGKLYIIEEIENSSKEAINSILKMLEEPLDNVFAIFTTKNIDLVLPTVISRCQVLKLQPNNKATIARLYLQNKYTNEDAYILSHVSDDYREYANYTQIKKESLNFINDLFLKKENLIINAQINIINKYNRKEDIQLFLNILIIIVKELYRSLYVGNSHIVDVTKLIETVRCFDSPLILGYIEILLDIEYQLGTNVNINLLMDKMMYQLLQGNK